MPSYRSGLEKEAAKKLRRYKYEPEGFEYTVRKKYWPDFVKGDIWIEVKGRFRNSEEAAKYIHIRNCWPSKRLVFLFQNPETPMPGAKKRKDGSKYTVSQWARDNGFEWATLETIGDRLRHV